MTEKAVLPKQFELTYRHGVVLVLLAGVFWSTMGLGIRNVADANSWQLLIYRSFSLSTFLFFILAIRSSGKPMQRIRQAGLAGVIGAWGLVIAFSGGVYAIQETTVANAMLLFAAAPFVAAVLGWIILKEAVSRTTWIAMFFAMIGITVMVAEGFSAGKVSGNIAAIASAMGFAVFSIALRWGRLGDMMPAVFLAGIFTTITSFIICWLNDYPLILTMNDATIAMILGVFQVGVGLTLYTLGSKVIPAAQLTLLSMTEVILGPFWVWLFLNETFSIYTFIGGVILILAIAYNALNGLRLAPSALQKM